MKDFFVSYNHVDRAWAEWIAWQLEASGFKTIIQAWDFRPGSNFVLEMDRAAQEARRMLAVLSPAYLTSAFTAPEWAVYLAKDPGGAKRLLLPVRVSECSVQGMLGPIVHIDLVGLEAEAAREALLGGIRGGRAKPPSAPGFPGGSPHHIRLQEPKFPGVLSAQISALEEAYLRKEELTIAGGDTGAVEREILELRREMRQGGRLRSGDLLADGRFRLVESLGHGGFATVWKAYDRQEQRLVAVKVLHGQHGADQSRLERFFRGARKMAELHHPGIVRVLDRHFDDGGYQFFVMEYVTGGDLRQAVLERQLAPEKVLPLITEVAAALQFAHQRGVIHRDVKPANILLDAEGRPKLTDFDLVRAFDTTGGTLEGGMMGTFLYTAPEAMQDPQEAGATADVYSLAMTAVFCFFGKELPVEVLRDMGKFLRQLPCTAEVRSILKKATAWELKRRFGSMADFARALEEGTAVGRSLARIFLFGEVGTGKSTICAAISLYFHEMRGLTPRVNAIGNPEGTLYLQDWIRSLRKGRFPSKTGGRVFTRVDVGFLDRNRGEELWLTFFEVSGENLRFLDPTNFNHVTRDKKIDEWLEEADAILLIGSAVPGEHDRYLLQNFLEYIDYRGIDTPIALVISEWDKHKHSEKTLAEVALRLYGEAAKLLTGRLSSIIPFSIGNVQNDDAIESIDFNAGTHQLISWILETVR